MMHQCVKRCHSASDRRFKRRRQGNLTDILQALQGGSAVNTEVGTGRQQVKSRRKLYVPCVLFPLVVFFLSSVISVGGTGQSFSCS